jgi:nucleoside-diphosphate-sugar epimerase
MTRRSVSLTGATGFLGPHLAAAFRAAGWDVRAIVRPGTRRRGPAGADVIEAPLVAPALAAAVDGTGVLVHAAALTRARDAGAFARVNVEGTRAAIEAANATGAELVFISSLAAAGPGTPARPAREDDRPEPITEYGRSKLSAERIVATEARVPWSIVRPSAVYGPGDRGFYPLFRLAARGRFPALTDALTAYTLIEAADLARGVVLVAEAPTARGTTLFLGHPRPQTTEEILQTLASTVGRPYRPRSVPRSLLRLLASGGQLAWRLGWRPALDRDRYAELTADGFVCAVDRAESLLGFRAATSLDAGFRRTFEWYRKEGWL